LICTVGTDFHNIDKMYLFIGDIKIKEEEIDKILDCLLK